MAPSYRRPPRQPLPRYDDASKLWHVHVRCVSCTVDERCPRGPAHLTFETMRAAKQYLAELEPLVCFTVSHYLLRQGCGATTCAHWRVTR